MLPNLASGPQNQPIEKVAVSVRAPWTFSFSIGAATAAALLFVVTIVFLPFEVSSWLGQWNGQRAVPSAKPASIIQTVKTDGMSVETLPESSRRAL